MKPLPKNDPYAFQARVYGALFDDLFDLGAGVSTRCDRLNALREVSKALSHTVKGLGNG